MSTRNWVRFQFASIPENVGFARTCAAAFVSQLDCTIEEIEEVKLVVSEAVSNSIIHGYENNRDNFVFVEIKLLANNAIEIMIEDQGRGIDDVDQALQPAYSSIPDRMGLGFVFMRSFSDELEVTSNVGQGTRVKMVKSLIPVREESGG